VKEFKKKAEDYAEVEEVAEKKTQDPGKKTNLGHPAREEEV